MQHAKKWLVVLAALAILAFGGAAYAQEGSVPGTPPGGNQVTNPEVEAEVVEAEGGVLPFTGADLTAFVLVGAAAVGTGAVVLRKTRTTKASL